LQQEKLLKKPTRVRKMPFDGAGFRHRLKKLIFGKKRGAKVVRPSADLLEAR
jgi:hypothetical protein